MRARRRPRSRLGRAASQRVEIADGDPSALGGDPPESTEASVLFVQAARRIDNQFAASDATAPAIAQICAALDGLPLALELAAARTGLPVSRP